MNEILDYYLRNALIVGTFDEVSSEMPIDIPLIKIYKFKLTKNKGKMFTYHLHDRKIYRFMYLYNKLIDVLETNIIC